MKFKENDFVKCISPGGYALTIGKIYRVVEVRRDSIKICNDSKKHSYYDVSRFELTPKFKNGDLVKCINNKKFAGVYSITIGKTYKVIEVEDGYIKICNDSKEVGFYTADRFELVEVKKSFSLSIEEDNIEDFLYKLKNAYNIVSDVARTEKDYEEAYLKLEALLNDKTDPLDVFWG